MPPAELPISVGLVRRLLDEQHPDLAHLAVEPLTNGWDNLVCRLGEDLLVRLPRRAPAAELAAHEHRWLPELAGRGVPPTDRRPRAVRMVGAMIPAPRSGQRAKAP